MGQSADPFGAALDETSRRQAAYADQLGMEDGRIPFAAESMPSTDIAVDVNRMLLQEVASHILNRAGHTLVTDIRGAGKTHFRDLVYDSLSSEDRRDDFRIARIKEVSSITERRIYLRVLDELRDDPELEIPEESELPHATDGVRAVIEDVAARLEKRDLCCIIQVDQLEDVAGDSARFRQLLDGLQSMGDLGDGQPVFLLFLFGTPEVTNRIDELKETLSSRLVAKDRSLDRFGFEETAELIGRWLAWARDEAYDDNYPIDPFAPAAVEAIVEQSDGTPRSTRQECYHAFRAGAIQYEHDGDIRVDAETIEQYA